jgi:hypothetical protein
MAEEDTRDDRGDPEEPEANEGPSPWKLYRAQAFVLVLEGAAALIEIYGAGVSLHWW